MAFVQRLGVLVATAAAFLAGQVGNATMAWPDLLARPKAQPTTQIAYGSDPLQHVDLWLPSTPKRHGRYPVVLMIHGGCWQTDVADATLMNYAAEALRNRGIAVWNIEYRGVDRAGGGYPGTLRDVASAADALRTHARRYNLDTSNVVAFGHSAGGHLALWLAARERLPKNSPLYVADPITIGTAISIGGLPDLEAAQTPPGNTCGVAAVHKLTGVPGRRNPYRDTSPVALAPIRAKQILINASRDRIAPPAFAVAYARRAGADASVRQIVVADEGHVELIAPGSVAWKVEVRMIEQALDRSPFMRSAHHAR